MKLSNDMQGTYDKSELDNRLFEGFADTSRRRYVYVCNMKTGISRWSVNAVEDFGLPGEYMKDAGLIWAEHIHPDDRSAYLLEISEIFEGKRKYHNMDYRALNRDGEYVICTCQGHVVKGKTEEEPDLFVGSIENHGIMDNVDAITHLYNIYEFSKFISRRRDAGEYLTVVMLGINKFNQINETYGYIFGNRVLREFGNRMRDVIKGRGMLFRMDGVRFACCFDNLSKEEILEIYKEMQYQARHRIYVDGIRIAVSIAAGAVVYDEYHNESTVITSGGYALEQSKYKQQGELVFFEAAVVENNSRNLEIMTIIRQCAMNQCEGFYLCYQPIVNAAEEKLIGAEALLRWRKEPYGEVPPGVFIPWLENDPVFWDLGNWIIKRALTEGLKLVQKFPDFVLNVNVAYPQLSHVGFEEKVKSILEETGFPAKNLCFELTERCRQLEKNY
ncbi:MAG: EAL domain-containing protein, partial [Eubacterium sp.]|nr:EAL domain-containing protein [Eubacterium sp.]